MRLAVIALFFLLTSTAFAFAWTGPTGSPPSNDVAAPINVSSTGQTKAGNLGVSGYLNFSSTLGSSGYGIWGNNGVLEFKNSGGSWQSLQSIICGYVSCTGSGAGWAMNGTTLYYSGGNVAIGAAVSSYPLSVNGDISASDVYDAKGGFWLSTAARYNGSQFWGSLGTADSNGYGETAESICPSDSVVVGIYLACGNYCFYEYVESLCQWIN